MKVTRGNSGNHKLSPHALEIAEGMEELIAHLKGETNEDIRIYPVEIPDRPPNYGPREVKKIRARTGMTQALFARLMNVSTKSIEGWESGTKSPGPSSRRLLQLASDKAALELVANAAGYTLVKKRDPESKSTRAAQSPKGSARAGRSRS